MPRKSASGGDDLDPVTPNPLQRLIRNRMAEMNWSYEDVERRGGPSHSTLYSILARKEFRTPLRKETLRKLSRGLDIPADVLRVANGQTMEYFLEGVPTTLETARGVRMIAASFEKLDAQRQKTAERIMRALLDEMKDGKDGAAGSG